MVKPIIRIAVLVVPWLLATVVPILLFPGFVDSNVGRIDLARIMGFGFVMIPLSPLMMFRCFVANPESSLALRLLMFVVGAVCPLVVALLLARFWSRRWFWLVLVGYFALLAFDTIVALTLVKEFV